MHAETTAGKERETRGRETEQSELDARRRSRLTRMDGEDGHEPKRETVCVSELREESRERADPKLREES